MLKKKVLLCVMIFFKWINVFAVGPLLTIDPTVNTSVITQFVTSLTQLYEMYDHTMNQIEMIQQKYEQMQFYIDRAANWNWNEIEWDGNLDFRNEIAKATKQVDKQLTNIRKIKNSLTSNTVSWGGQSYSIASLAGIDIDGQGNLEDFVKEGAAYYDNGFKKAAKTWAEGVPENEAQYIWSKYGLNPANYKMVRDVERKLSETTGILIGYIEDSPEKKEIEEEQYKIIENIMNMLQQEGATPDQIASVNAMLQEQTIFSLRDIEKKIEQAIGYMAWYNQLVAQKEEAEKQSRMERIQQLDKNDIPDFF